MARGDMGLPKVTQPASAQAPKGLPKIAGRDHCAIEVPGELGDLDWEVEIVDSPGHAGKPR